MLLATSAFVTTVKSAVIPSCSAELSAHLGEGTAQEISSEAEIVRQPAEPNLLFASRMVRATKAKPGTTSSADDALREAKAALAQGHFDDALQHCQEGLRSDPNSALAYLLLGMIQIRRGAEGEARQALLQSLKLDSVHSAAHYYIGKIYLAASEFPAAENEFRATIRLGDPSGAGGFQLGLTLLAESRYTEAISYLRTAVNENKNDPERLFTLIGAELQLNQLARARQCLIQAKERFPRDPALAYRIGEALLEYHLPDDAEAEFERAAGLLVRTANNPSPPNINVSDLSLQMARLHFDRHDYWGALDDLGKVEIVGVSARLRASAWHLAGQSLVGVGRAPEALDSLQRAVHFNPENPEYPVHLTWAQLLAGDTETAATTAQLAASRWPDVPDVQLMQTLVKRESAAIRERVPLAQEWYVKGEGFVCCPCKMPCPCRSNGTPTHKNCENTGLIRIHQGHYGKVSLDGFSFVAVNDAMEAQTGPAILYVEPSATDEQLVALERIMQSFNPLQPSIILSIERVPISFISTGPGAVVEIIIPKLLEIRIRRTLGRDGKPLFATAALDQFSNTIEYAQNLTYKLWDHDRGLKWDYSGRQANFRNIDLDSRAYTRQTMLIQFADASGAFNKKQLQLIKSQNLPLPHESLRDQPTKR